MNKKYRIVVKSMPDCVCDYIFKECDGFKFDPYCFGQHHCDCLAKEDYRIIHSRRFDSYAKAWTFAHEMQADLQSAKQTVKQEVKSPKRHQVKTTLAKGWTPGGMLVLLQELTKETN